MVQPCHSLVPQQLFADPCSMLENTEQDSKSCCTSSATRPRFDIDTNRRIASAPLRFNLLTRLMNKPPGRARRGAGQGRVHRLGRAGWLRAGWLRAAWRYRLRGGARGAARRPVLAAEPKAACAALYPRQDEATDAHET